MKITGKYFLHARKGAITQQYPENRQTLQMIDRFRGEVIMPHDENNEHRCTGCQSCEIACPNGTIEIIWDRLVNEETGKKKKTIDKFNYFTNLKSKFINRISPYTIKVFSRRFFYGSGQESF